MISLVLLATMTVVTFIIFGNSRQTHERKHWSDQSPFERLMISLALAGAIQFLFITMAPGWIVAAIVLGKGGFTETRLGNEVWAVVMMVANTLFYLPIFYLLFGRLNESHRRNTNTSELDLMPTSNEAQRGSKRQ